MAASYYNSTSRKPFPPVRGIIHQVGALDKHRKTRIPALKFTEAQDSGDPFRTQTPLRKRHDGTRSASASDPARKWPSQPLTAGSVRRETDEHQGSGQTVTGAWRFPINWSPTGIATEHGDCPSATSV